MATRASRQSKPKKTVSQSKSAMTVGGYILEKLKEKGVEHIFGVPGDYIIRFNKIVEEHPSISFINATRENTAGYMADAYARVRGLGVACTAYGVGVNIVNALYQAYSERSPVILISGSPSRDEYRHSPLAHHLIANRRSEITDYPTAQRVIFEPVTVEHAYLDDPATAPEKIDNIIDICLWHRKPVYIELTRNIVDLPIPSTHKYVPYEFPSSDADALKEALQETLEILQSSKKPFIWVGKDIQTFELAEELLKFANRCRIPIATTTLGKTVIDEQHPLAMGIYLGKAGRKEVTEYIKGCDCALIIGQHQTDIDTAIFSTKNDFRNSVLVTPEKIMINHHIYPKVHFADFVRGLSKLSIKKHFKGSFPTNAARKIKPFKAVAGKKITAARVYECLGGLLTEEHIVTADFGDALFGCHEFMLAQDSFISCANFGTLGFGVPAAVAAQIASPKKRIVGIIGDGAFQMTGIELSTAVRYGLDPIIIVLNNHGYGTERLILEGKFNDIVNWNYAELPRLLNGGIGMRATTEEELEGAFTAALKQRGQYILIEIELDKLDMSTTLKKMLARS